MRMRLCVCLPVAGVAAMRKQPTNQRQRQFNLNQVDQHSSQLYFKGTQTDKTRVHGDPHLDRVWFS